MRNSLLASAILALGLAGTVNAAPVNPLTDPMQWTTGSGANNHWYQVVYLPQPQSQYITWDQANTAAQSMTYLGQTGYLASITSAAEQAYLNTVNLAYTAASGYYNVGEYVKAWLGGNDVANEGTWAWNSGETFAYDNWADNEPNNSGNEDHLQGWWSGDKWNDCSGTCGVRKFVVEFNSAPPVSNVPLPASLPLIIAGLGAMGFFGRRKKS